MNYFLKQVLFVVFGTLSIATSFYQKNIFTAVFKSHFSSQGCLTGQMAS